MKFLSLAVLALVGLMAGTTQAAFLTSGSTAFDTGGPANARLAATVNYEVYSAGSTAYGVTVGAGEFGYFYQITNTSPSQRIETFVIDSSKFDPTTVGQGTSGLILDGTGTGTPGATVNTAANPLSPTRPGAFGDNGSQTYWNFAFNSGTGLLAGSTSSVLYFIGTHAPGTGTGFLANPKTANGAVAVPVPVPAGVALALIGLPLAGLIRRKMARA